MNTNKNSYTIIYTVVLVAIVATVLAFVSSALKQRQLTNIAVEKQQSILRCAGLAEGVKTAPDKNAYIQKEFAQRLKAALVIDLKGNVRSKDTTDFASSKAFKLEPSEQHELLPVFICKTDKGPVQIISCYGAGLWGPIWGYIAVKEDLKSLAGALFDHKSETPGLGGEIVTDKFRNQFIDKIIFDGQNFTPVKVVKGGAKDAMHEVDALSGATITSTAVQAMLEEWLGYYKPYFDSCRQALEAENEEVSAGAEKNVEQ